MSKQNDLQTIQDMVQQGMLSVDDANVLMIRNERFRLVHKLPASVRKALNAAVKSGVLGHLKKDGVKPEAYFHPTFKYLAEEARERQLNAAVRALQSICC